MPFVFVREEGDDAAVVETGVRLVKQVSTPLDPPANTVDIFLASDGAIKYVDEDGTVQSIGSGGGGGGMPGWWDIVSTSGSEMVTFNGALRSVLSNPDIDLLHINGGLENGAVFTIYNDGGVQIATTGEDFDPALKVGSGSSEFLVLTGDGGGYVRDGYLAWGMDASLVVQVDPAFVAEGNPTLRLDASDGQSGPILQLRDSDAHVVLEIAAGGGAVTISPSDPITSTGMTVQHGGDPTANNDLFDAITVNGRGFFVTGEGQLVIRPENTASYILTARDPSSGQPVFEVGPTGVASITPSAASSYLLNVEAPSDYHDDIARFFNADGGGLLIHENNGLIYWSQDGNDQVFVVQPTGAVTISPSDDNATNLTLIPHGNGANDAFVIDMDPGEGVGTFQVTAGGELTLRGGYDGAQILNLYTGYDNTTGYLLKAWAGGTEVLSIGPTGSATFSPSADVNAFTIAGVSGGTLGELLVVKQTGNAWVQLAVDPENIYIEGAAFHINDQSHTELFKVGPTGAVTISPSAYSPSNDIFMATGVNGDNSGRILSVSDFDGNYGLTVQGDGNVFSYNPSYRVFAVDVAGSDPGAIVQIGPTGAVIISPEVDAIPLILRGSEVQTSPLLDIRLSDDTSLLTVTPAGLSYSGGLNGLFKINSSQFTVWDHSDAEIFRVYDNGADPGMVAFFSATPAGQQTITAADPTTIEEAIAQIIELKSLTTTFGLAVAA